MLSKDEFYMWRTLFALAHIDEILTKEEKLLIQSRLPAEELSDCDKVKLLPPLAVRGVQPLMGACLRRRGNGLPSR